MSDPDDIGLSRAPARAATTPLAGRIALWLLGLGVLVFVYVLFAATSKPQDAGLGAYATGAMRSLSLSSEAPPQTSRGFQGENGAAYTLADFRGRVLVVNFWATNCAPCLVEMPTLGTLARRFDGQEVAVVAISLDNASDTDKAKRMLLDLSQGALHFYIDPTRGVALDSRAGGMPTTVIFDRDGVELARLTGEADWSSQEAFSLIEAILAEP